MHGQIFPSQAEVVLCHIELIGWITNLNVINVDHTEKKTHAVWTPDQNG